ncbi:Sensor histidine kinase DesK [Streptomyces hundungensis]|uniref:Sensor histidine kinase DesK n=1 Tax=Streptomyces hundungensis TaxID=1077946 RepID=A0A387HPN6_9ACTN|nr:histidine kinase [Streptomyces hundungensis]AYG82988.1 Sensor histidine kinase DesK [Streptomyces hundungensis]
MELPPRKAIAVTAAALLGFFVIDAVFIWAENPPWWERIGALFGFVVIMGLQLGHSFPQLLPKLYRHRYATWCFQAVLAYAPIYLFGSAWSGMAEFLTASSVLVFPAAIGWPLFGVGVLTCWYLYSGNDVSTVLYNVLEGALIPLIIIGLSRMSDMIVKLHRSREELSRLAVAGERLRFARDLHDVLGYSLSAISLKCELAYRLLSDAPDKAQEELAEVLRTSRRALADVRSVSRGYREMSLAGEANAAVSMLSAAGIRTTLKFEVGQLPPAVDTVLATALREGLTNMLRHSKAESCEIRAERRGAGAVLVLANDGIGRGRVPKGGADGGLAALDSRVKKLGGTLDHGSDGQGWFRLEVAVPVPDRAERDQGDLVAAAEADDHGQPEAQSYGHRDLVPRTATAIAFTVLVGYFLAYSVVAMSYHPPLGRAVAVELCMFAALVLQLAVSFQWRFTWASNHARLLGYGALGGLLLLHAVPWSSFGPTWLGMPGFVAGSALLVLPTVSAWALVVAVTVASDIALHQVGGTLTDLIYTTAYTVICALVVFGLSRMAQLASELHWSRTEIARLAVTTERLRFARDLHDLLGFSLSAITLKCELVRRLTHSRTVQAQEELTEVLGIARQALADVRTVADGRQRMSLTAEAANATAMLAGVGIRATVDTDCGELPGDVDTVLATMLREGLTNMLRHSKAAHCRITAERTAAGVRLTLVNDGVQGCADAGLDSKVNGGSGIGNLTTRVNAVNGRLEAGARPDGWFELKAEVQLLAVAA